MREKLLAFIAKNPRTSFSEVEQFFEQEGFEYVGDSSIDLRAGSNIMLWSGWNHEAVSLILELARSGQIRLGPASWVEALCFGKAFNLPNPKRLDHDYRQPHWLPAVITVADEEAYCVQ